jgi:hypothetical protein
MFGIDLGWRTSSWRSSNAGRVAALRPGLMHPQAMEIVAVREEADIRDKTARGDIGVELGHPYADAVGAEHLFPCRVQRPETVATKFVWCKLILCDAQVLCPQRINSTAAE